MGGTPITCNYWTDHGRCRRPATKRVLAETADGSYCGHAERCAEHAEVQAQCWQISGYAVTVEVIGGENEDDEEGRQPADADEDERAARCRRAYAEVMTWPNPEKVTLGMWQALDGRWIETMKTWFEATLGAPEADYVHEGQGIRLTSKALAHMVRKLVGRFEALLRDFGFTPDAKGDDDGR